MIYVTGDTHGDLDALLERRTGQIKKGDILIITGDFGFIWDDSKEEAKNLKKLSKKKYSILFAEGAHENFEKIREYEETELFGGKVYKISDNIFCLQRGELYSIEGKNVLALGGGMPPYADEDADTSSLPSDDELKHAVDNIQSLHRKVDVIITHEAPASVKKLIDRQATVNDLNIFLDTVLHNTRYGRWYFGSLHQDRMLSDNLICVYEDVHRVE